MDGKHGARRFVCCGVEGYETVDEFGVDVYTGVPEERACWALRVQVLQTVQRRRGAAFDPTGENSRVGDARWERAEKQFEIQGTLLRS